MRRVAIIGLDSAPPELVFHRWRHRLPTLDALMSRGIWGCLRSSHPPITVPAWSSMLSSRDPGELGLYGFRNRRSRQYGDHTLASSRSVTVPRLWDVLGRAGLRSILVGVPQTYPPPPVNGSLLSCFLTPSGAAVVSHPADLRGEIDSVCGGYQFDVDDFRSADRASLRQRIRTKTGQDFAAARHVLRTRPWEFFMMVTMGTDRMQHAFWPNADLAVDDPSWDTLRDYYEYVDGEIAELLSLLDDDTVVMVVSDHGAKAMQGGICLNQWLIDNRWLTLHEQPKAPTALTPEMVDWDRTVAWGDGGYCGRIFLNVRGREPKGTVAGDDVERVRDDLIAGIQAIHPDGPSLESTARRPEDLYTSVEGFAPDLMVYFGDLSWRALGSVGHPGVHSRENDTGRDGANHDWDGIFILADRPNGSEDPRREGMQLMDVTPTVLSFYDDCGLDWPLTLRGKAIERAPGI